MKMKSCFSLLTPILVYVIIMMFSANYLFSQSSHDIKKEILVYIQSDSINFPSSELGQLAPNKFQINSKALARAVDKAKVKSVSKAFPDISIADSIHITEHGEKIHKYRFSNIFRFHFEDIADIDSAIIVISKIPGVLFAEKNMDAHLFSDPTYSNQWYLNNIGQSGGTPSADIKAEQAWSIFTGSPSVTIGIVDGGVQTTHPDLSGKASGDLPTASNYHGTHVAGIAAAKANNNEGGRGVDWNAQIISRSIFDYTLPEPAQYLGDITAANKTMSAADNAQILNHSWGGSSYSTAVRMAFAYAYKLNRVSVVAMGNNNGNQTQYPAGFDQGVIAVGSTQDNDAWSTFSDYGNHIDVAAPGGKNPFGSNDQHDIWSTWGTNTYQYIAGTSMAAPVVSGIASLLKGYNSSLYNDDIEHIIELSADDVNSATLPGWDIYLGYGRVNARKALDLLRPPYTLVQSSTVGGSDLGGSGLFRMIIYGAQANGLADGDYYVKRHEVQKTITFPRCSNVNVWGRGIASNGWNYGNPNFAIPYCDIVPGTVTSTSATLRTCVYEVYDQFQRFIGWFPAQPSNVTFAYTVLSTPPPPPLTSATTTGLSTVSAGEEYTYTVTPTGGTAPYNYHWWIQTSGVQEFAISNTSSSTLKGGSISPNQIEPPPTWQTIGSNSPTLSTIQYQNFALKCDVTDAEGTTVTSNIFYVTVSTLPPSPPAAPINVALQSSSGTYGTIKVSWTNEDVPPDYFEVNRLVMSYPGVWEVVATTTNTYWVDQEYIYAPGGGDFNTSYKIRAIKNSLYSDYSATASVRAEWNGKLIFSNSNREGQLAVEIPQSFALNQNFPNPFNPTTTISFDLPKDSPVSLRIYDMVGHEIATLVDGYRPAGRYNFSFDASKLSSGMYIYKIQAGEFSAIKKMQVLK